jgi:copper(I)-binding protein
MRNLFQNGLLALLLAGIWLTACSPPGQNPGLAFEEAWVRAMPPGMKMTAAFGQLINSGEQAIEITGFSSPSFGDVSLHRTVQVEGMSEMRPVSRLSIAPGDRVELVPGGYHLMLMMPTAVIEPGTRIVVDLKSTGGQIFSFNIPVERR